MSTRCGECEPWVAIAFYISTRSEHTKGVKEGGGGGYGGGPDLSKDFVILTFFKSKMLFEHEMPFSVGSKKCIKPYIPYSGKVRQQGFSVTTKCVTDTAKYFKKYYTKVVETERGMPAVSL